MSNIRINQIAWTLALASARGNLCVPGEFHWNHATSDSFEHVRQKWHSVFNSGDAVRDQDMLDSIQKTDVSKFLADIDTCARFESSMRLWISQGNGYYTLSGFNSFPIAQTVNGSQEAFNHFYFRHRESRFRVHRGEYWWHMETWDALGLDWCYIEDKPLAPGDVCILSMPFALDSEQKALTLDTCDHLGIPVLLDLIYLPNAVSKMHIDVDRECVKEITVSLSKTFPVQTAKCAVRFCRTEPKDALTISTHENVSNRLSAGLGLCLIEQYAVDYMVKKYQPLQQYWCDQLDLSPGNVVHFGYGKPMSDRLDFSDYNLQSSRYNLRLLYENNSWLEKMLW